MASAQDCIESKSRFVLLRPAIYPHSRQSPLTKRIVHCNPFPPKLQLLLIFIPTKPCQYVDFLLHIIFRPPKGLRRCIPSLGGLSELVRPITNVLPFSLRLLFDFIFCDVA